MCSTSTYLKGNELQTFDWHCWIRYNDYTARTAPYLVWPDARLRAYLRENNISEEALPTSRPGLLRRSPLLFAFCILTCDVWIMVTDWLTFDSSTCRGGQDPMGSNLQPSGCPLSKSLGTDQFWGGCGWGQAWEGKGSHLLYMYTVLIFSCLSS